MDKEDEEAKKHTMAEVEALMVVGKYAMMRLAGQPKILIVNMERGLEGGVFDEAAVEAALDKFYADKF